MRESIIKASENEAEILSQLAFNSKSHWGYDSEFMDNCKSELTYSTEDILDSQNHFYKIIFNNNIAGFYRLLEISANEIELEALFISPEFIGQSFGKKLFDHAVGLSKSLGYDSIKIQSDPYAEEFYLKMGAIKIGEEPSGSIPGRVLPLMKYEI